MTKRLLTRIRGMTGVLVRGRGQLQFLHPIASRRYSHRSFSQTGEDRIVRFIFDQLGVSRPSYLDIGAYRPFEISNTAMFYVQGSRGITVEADPDAFARLQRHRKGDINLNLGCAAEAGRLRFHRMTIPTLNTFSAESAAQAVAEHDGALRVEAVVDVDVLPLAEILHRHGQGGCPDFLSLDVEGLDLSILRSMSDWPGKPTVICAETLTYSAAGTGTKIREIGEVLESHGYFAFADTYINTIFVLHEAWQSKGSSEHQQAPVGPPSAR